MPISTTLKDKLTSLEQNIALYKKEAAQLPQIDASTQQKLTQLEALSKKIQQLLSADETEQAPQEDDWQVLLERSDLPETTREFVRTFIRTQHLNLEDATNYVVLV